MLSSVSNGIGHAQHAGGVGHQLAQAHGSGRRDAVGLAGGFSLDDGRQQAARQSLLHLGLGDQRGDVGVAHEGAERPVGGVAGQGVQLLAQEERRQREHHRVAVIGDGGVDQPDGRRQHEHPGGDREADARLAGQAEVPAGERSPAGARQHPQRDRQPGDQRPQLRPQPGEHRARRCACARLRCWPRAAGATGRRRPRRSRRRVSLGTALARHGDPGS